MFIFQFYQISEREHVSGLLVEHEKHGGRPGANPLHGRQAADDVIRTGGGVHQDGVAQTALQECFGKS